MAEKKKSDKQDTATKLTIFLVNLALIAIVVRRWNR